MFPEFANSNYNIILLGGPGGSGGAGGYPGHPGTPGTPGTPGSPGPLILYLNLQTYRVHYTCMPLGTTKVHTKII